MLVATSETQSEQRKATANERRNLDRGKLGRC